MTYAKLVRLSHITNTELVFFLLFIITFEWMRIKEKENSNGNKNGNIFNAITSLFYSPWTPRLGVIDKCGSPLCPK